MDPLTIVTAAPSPEADELRELLERWVAVGLLHPILWVEAEEDFAGPDAARTGRWLSEGGSQDVGLLAKAGERPHPLIRLVAVQLLHRDGAAPKGALPGTDVEAVLVRAKAANTMLNRINLVVPSTGVKDLSPAWLTPLWDANVIASPEDRISSAHVDQQVHHPDNLLAHAALALATVAGAWVSVEKGPFDERRIPQVGDRVNLVVARGFARVIRAESMVEDITGQLLAGAPHSRINAAGAVPARDPARVAGRLASEFVQVDDGALRFRPQRPQPAPAQKVVGILSAFGMMFRYIWARLRRAPRLLGQRWESRVREGLVRWAQGATFGKDSTVAVRFGGRPGVSDSDQEQEDLPPDAARDARDVAEHVLEQMQVPVSPPAAPRVWEAFRRTSIGLVDAGDFPDFLKPPSDGARREALADLDLVVPDPAPDPVQLETVDHEIRPCDPYQAEAARVWLSDRLTEAQAQEEQEQAATLMADLAALETWIARRSGSFAWRVGVAMGEELDKAERSFDQNIGIAQAGPLALDEAAAAKAARRLRRWWTLLFILFLSGVGIALWRYLSQDPWSQVAAIGGFVLVVWVLASLFSFLQYQRAMFRIEHRHSRSLHEYASALEGAENDAREVARLSALYEQYREWAEIVGWVVHHPGGLLQQPDEPQESSPPIARPAALQVGRGEPSEDSLMAASARVARQAFHAGWLQKLYTRYRASSMASLKFTMGLDQAAPDPDPDRDIAPPSPRLQVLEDLKDSKFAADWRNELRGQVIEVLEQLDPSDIFVSVMDEDDPAGHRQPVEVFLGGLLPSPGHDEALTAGIWTVPARAARRDEVHEMSLWGPESFATTQTAAQLSILPTRAHVGVDRPFTLEAIRLDLSDTCVFDEVSIFGPQAPDAPDLDKGDSGPSDDVG